MNLEMRDWIAYQINHLNDIDLVVNKVQLALQNNKEKDLNGLVLHSDQGSQYFSTEV
jgi:putative transposase